MIKICQVVSDTNIGGAGRYLLNYLKYYDRDKYEVSVVLPENSSLLEFVSKYPEVEIFSAPYMADKSYDGRCVKFLTKLFSDKKFDILSTHASLSARIAGRKARVGKIISTRHCIEPECRFPVSIIKSVLNNLLCDYYIAVSDAVAENLSLCGISKKKIVTVYNGVNEVATLRDEEKIDIRRRYGVSDQKVFSVFARLEEVKGHRYFIEAAKKYLQKRDDAVFLIVGDGSLMPELKKQAEDIPQIKFCGYVKDTCELLNITDVNVISSSSEAMSLAILEAMSLKKPTIATNVGGNPQLIRNGENGILVEYADENAMCDAFLKMTEDEEFFKKASFAAYRDFKRSFTAEIMIENLEKLYWEVAYERK